MGKIGKIATIPKDISQNGNIQTMQSSLASRGLTRVPGTGVFKYPYKEFDGRYRTGLDPNAAYIKRMSNELERQAEIERVTKLRDRLQDAFGSIDISPSSKFWNHALSTSTEDEMHVRGVKLIDGENVFDLSIPMQELTFAWLRVHPTIASSLAAYQRGEYPADTQFYVADEEVENALLYKKKESINKAVLKFHEMTPEKRRKVARLLGLPVTDNTKDEIVYNQVDTLLKKTEIEDGAHKGMSPIQVFNSFADMKDNLLHVSDLVKQAISHSIYRVKPNGKIYEGELEVATDEQELILYLVDEDNQDVLLALEGKLKGKKLATV